MAWMLVTHVCRRWRLIAIESAGLWESIIFGSRRSWKPFVDRSQQAPLQVTLYISENDDVKAVWPVLQNIHRIRTLDLRGAQVFNVLQLPCVSVQAPLLETLILSTEEYKPSQKRLVKIDNDILLSLFEGTPSRLSRLELKQIPIRADSHLFSKSITWLALKGCDNENVTAKLPLASLIEVLHRLPALEVLCLEAIIADPVSSDKLEKSLANIPVVHMSKLYDLISYPELPLIQKAFMSRISAPQLTMLGMGAPIETRGEVAQPFVPPLISWTDDPDSFLFMDILESSKCLTIYGGPEHSLDEVMELGTPGPTSVSVHSREEIPEWNDTIVDVCLQMPLHKVRSLQLFYATYPMDWAPMFVRMDSLEEIIVVIWRWRDVLQVLISYIVHDGITRLFCLKLKKLKLLMFGQSLESFPDAFHEGLSTVLAVRKENGVDLEVVFDEGEEPEK
ncbi:hypothetical protein DENSPDRAFT_679585 [Dentipellis sp. KUC8613]|nr:hypothetical protein DENSPDRAFT_679585 [Dentipellis sp. KUC8613]